MASMKILSAWKADWKKGISLNGKHFPYLITATGPVIEPIDEGSYILWLPIIAVGNPTEAAQNITGKPAEAEADNE